MGRNSSKKMNSPTLTSSSRKLSSMPPNRNSKRKLITTPSTKSCSDPPVSSTRSLCIDKNTSSIINNNSSHKTRSSSMIKPPKDSKERLAAYKSSMGKSKPTVVKRSSSMIKESAHIQSLALQSYHLLGNNWCQDWWQFMVNNHPVFGICFHHKLHPIKSCTRIVALIGTIIFGLVLTNMFHLFYLWNPRFNQEVFTVSTSSSSVDDDWTLTTGMILLWTVGGGIHAAYNFVIWHIAACACCRPGGFCESMACCPSLGKHLLRFFVVMNIGFGVIVVLMRVAISNTNANNETITDDDQLHFLPEDQWEIEVDNAQEFQFLLGYLVEMVLALFVYYPLGGTILFSGILGCGKLPVLGGRPAEIRAEQKRQEKQGSRELRLDPTSSTSGSVVHDVEAQHSDSMANEDEVELVLSLETKLNSTRKASK